MRTKVDERWEPVGDGTVVVSDGQNSGKEVGPSSHEDEEGTNSVRRRILWEEKRTTLLDEDRMRSVPQKILSEMIETNTKEKDRVAEIEEGGGQEKGKRVAEDVADSETGVDWGDIIIWDNDKDLMLMGEERIVVCSFSRPGQRRKPKPSKTQQGEKRKRKKKRRVGVRHKPVKTGTTEVKRKRRRRAGGRE